MSALDELLDELEGLLVEIDGLDDSVRGRVLALLDGIDALLRLALTRLTASVGPEAVERARAAEPAVAWLLEAYAIGVDERAAAEAALDDVRPYLHSHGGDVAVLAARGGVVHVKLSGACSGCTASTITLRRGVEEALRERMPGFAAMEVEEDDALPHPPPGPTLLQIAEPPPLLTIESFTPAPPGRAGAE
jgi:Fe-S cluster biogenesis protein NfuA